MQEASASRQGMRDLDLDPDPGPTNVSFQPFQSPTNYSLPPSSRPSIALELYDRFGQINANVNETEDDVTMTDITPDGPSFVPIQSSITKSLPNDETSGHKVRKRNNQSPTADNLNSKKVLTRVSTNDKPASSVDCPNDASFQPDKIVPNFASSFRYCSRDKPPFIVHVQPVQESDSTTLHPLHISRILSQIFPRGILEIKKKRA